MATYNGHQEDSSGNILLSIGNGMTATVETGSTASQAYTKGAYLFFNNRLCKASTAIASGATLAVGTNLTQTSLGAELTSHLRSSDGKEFYFDVKDGSYGYYPSASKTASEFVPFGGTSVTDVTITFAGYQSAERNIYLPKGLLDLYTSIEMYGYGNYTIDSGSTIVINPGAVTLPIASLNVTNGIYYSSYKDPGTVKLLA